MSCAGKCIFNDLWIQRLEYKGWLRREPSNRHKAFCTLCKKSLDISKMGESAVAVHHKGKKHQALIKASTPAVSMSRFVETQSFAAAEEGSTVSTAASSTSTPTSKGFSFTKSDTLAVAANVMAYNFF